MKRFLLLASVLLSASLVGAGVPRAIRWQTKFEKARSGARDGKRPILIDFAAKWCGPCRLMEETTFTNPDVIHVLNQMVCVRIDIDQNARLASQFQVSSIPRIVVMDSQGRTVIDSIGYQDAEALLSSLEGSASSLRGVKFPRSASGSLAARSADPTAALVEDLGHSMRNVRERAERQLREMQTGAVSHLLNGLSHEHLAVRIGSFSTMSDLVKLPATLLYDPWAKKPVRDKAVRALKEWWSRENKRE